MFTDCPGCQRQFRLTARHLSAAGGEVRCGYCGMRFNALGRLHDAPLPSLAPLAGPPEPGEPVVEEPGVAAPEFETGTEPDSEPEPEFDIAMAEPLPAAPMAMDWTAGRGGAATRRGPQAADEPDADPSRRTGPWAALVLLLIMAGALQVAWFERDTVLAHYPRLRPHVEQWCAKLDCSVLRRRDLSAITVLNRDVRMHPRYEDTLLVNATISNGAAFVQPWPRIELALSDTSGRVLAARAFAADEYLDGSMDRQRGMAPGMPVHVVLEIAGAGPDAASFEIGFK